MTVDKAIEYKAKCPYCGSIITFKLNEVKDDPGSCLHNRKGISCPNCNLFIITHWDGQLCDPILPIYESETECNDCSPELEAEREINRD